MKATLILLTLFLSGNALAARKSVARSLASIETSLRVDHARELMGDRYHKSVVSSFETRAGLEENILKTVSSKLPKAYKNEAHEITQTIIQESTKHGLDPYFVMAVISGESSFNPKAIGPVGEIGLMQIRPATGEWIAKKIKFPWKGDNTLNNPIANIKLGAAYIAWLREKFNNHSQLYLAAYNMGAKSVKNAVTRNVWPKDYPRHVMKRYLAFYKAI